MTLRELLQGGERGSQDIQRFCNRAGSLNVKSVLLIKENQTSQVKEFSAFLCMGRCRSLGSLKSLLWFASQLSGAFSPWVPRGSPAQISLVYWHASKYSASQVPRAKVEAVLKWDVKPRGWWSIRGKNHGTIISQPEQGGVGNEPVSPRLQLNSRGIHDFNNNSWNCESFWQTMVTAE